MPSLSPLPSPGLLAGADSDPGSGRVCVLRPNLAPAVASATTVSSSTNPAVFGQAVTFTASVSGSGGIPTGAVVFLDGSTTLGTGTLNGSAQATFATSALAVATHSIRAVYGGNANFAGSTSSTFLQTVIQDATASVVVSSLDPAIYSQTITFTVTVSAAGPGAGTPTGTVSLLFAIRGGLGQATLNAGGQATFTTSTLVPADYTVQASYQGDANFAAGHSAYITQTVLKDSTATMITSSPNPSNLGQAVTFVATVSTQPPGSGSPAGNVAFMDDGVSVGGGTLNGGTATFVTSGLTAGVQSITTVYGGSAGFASSTSAVLDQTVRSQSAGPASTTTSLTSSVDPAVFGQPATFTASVSSTSPGTPTGTVAFVDGTTTLGAVALGAGDAVTLTTAALAVGNHTVTAVYGGDANFAASRSAGLVQTVSPDASTTVLGVSTTHPLFGQAVVFTIGVGAAGPGSGTPTGTAAVDFALRGGLGTVALNSSGLGTISTSTLAPGTFTLEAVYNGDANFTTSHSAWVTIVVAKDATTTTIASSINPSVYEQPVTFTATVTANAPGTGTPTGAVAFLDGATTLGTGTLSAGSASFTISSLAAGVQSITAVYGGSPDFAGSASALLIQTVILLSTITTLTSSINPSVFGQSVTFTASVSGAGGTPAGTVIFEDGGATLGTATLSGGTAAFSDATLSVGTHTSITAVYAGYASFAGSTSTAVSQSVSLANTSTTISSSLNPSGFGQSVTFTATVTVLSPGTNAAANPTGTVTFFADGNSIGTGTLSDSATDTATLTTSMLSGGTHPITASYGGDADFTGSSSGGGLTTLSSFNHANGDAPGASLEEDGSDDLFGTTRYGGLSGGFGTVFEVQADSATVTTLASFNGADGKDPYGSVVEDASGSLFGTTSGYAQGDGTVFEVQAGTGTITTLASLDGVNGEFPVDGLIEDRGGNLLGTANVGGANVGGANGPFGEGTVFEVAAGGGTITALASFNGVNGAYPTGGLVEDGSGNLFGSTEGGGIGWIAPLDVGDDEIVGNPGDGTLFEIASGSGTITTLTFFNSTNGASPYAGLLEDGNGNLFGTTQSGGAFGDGTVFEVRAGSGAVTTLATFNGDNGADPLGGLLEDASGNLFGTTSEGGASGYGTVFDVGADSGAITTLASFNNINGANPYGGLVESRIGNLFGTTIDGGAFGYGTVFQLSVPLEQTVVQSPTTTRLTSSTNPSVFGQSVTFTATVSGTGGTATGMVTFEDGGATLGTAALSGGTASFSDAELSVGSHPSITAVYSGDVNFAGSTSAAVSQSLSQASTATTVTSSLNPSVFGQNVTFTATVTVLCCSSRPAGAAASRWASREGWVASPP